VELEKNKFGARKKIISYKSRGWVFIREGRLLGKIRYVALFFSFDMYVYAYLKW